MALCLTLSRSLSFIEASSFGLRPNWLYCSNDWLSHHISSHSLSLSFSLYLLPFSLSLPHSFSFCFFFGISDCLFLFTYLAFFFCSMHAATKIVYSVLTKMFLVTDSGIQVYPFCPAPLPTSQSKSDFVYIIYILIYFFLSLYPSISVSVTQNQRSFSYHIVQHIENILKIETDA